VFLPLLTKFQISLASNHPSNSVLLPDNVSCTPREWNDPSLARQERRNGSEKGAGATMSTNVKKRATVGIRIVPVLMMVGGVWGVVGAVRLINYYLNQQEFFQLVVPGCSLPLFAWTSWVGWGVWKGEAWAFSWAIILFAFQVLSFNVGGSEYEFWTGVSARIFVGGWMVPMPPPSHSVGISGDFGSLLHLNFTGEDLKWTVGLNPVALGVLIYLSRLSRMGPTEVSTATDEHVEAAIERGPRTDATQ
jgi:hypothetical protein